ncbi:GNAT family N-acetyltransferase [Terrabacter sp. 2RAF25]|uniref:GNAT family N-acetyltransferase n=1 Tax=Terrabacter sp. 2RAF25 TaxID=3232998 RepID=UPI003F9E627E
MTAPGLRTDLDLLELQGSTVIDRGDHLVVHTEANPTFWWGNFVLVAGPPRAARLDHWVAAFEREHPDATHCAIAFTEAGGDTRAWVDRGWDVETDVDLATTTLPSGGDAPDGIRLRELVSDGDWEQSAEVGGSGTPADRRDERLTFERRRAAAQRGLVESGRARWFGAFDGDRLVSNLGIVRLGDLARYQDVVTLESHRRRGIAGALVCAAGEWAFEDPSVTRLVIVADLDGPARGLYERAGFAEVARHTAVSRSAAQPDAGTL